MQAWFYNEAVLVWQKDMMELEAQRSLVRLVRGGRIHVRSAWNSWLTWRVQMFRVRDGAKASEEQMFCVFQWREVPRNHSSRAGPCGWWSKGLEGAAVIEDKGWQHLGRVALAGGLQPWHPGLTLSLWCPTPECWNCQNEASLSILGVLVTVPGVCCWSQPCCVGLTWFSSSAEQHSAPGWADSFARSKWEQCVNELWCCRYLECPAEYLWLHLISEALMDAVCAQGMAAWEHFNNLLTVLFWLSLVLKITYVNMKLLLIFLLKLYYAQRFNERNIKVMNSLGSVCCLGLDSDL